jgi:hypothetical protein
MLNRIVGSHPSTRGTQFGLAGKVPGCDIAARSRLRIHALIGTDAHCAAEWRTARARIDMKTPAPNGIYDDERP